MTTTPTVPRRQFCRGQILIHQGDPGGAVAWLIESGQVEVRLAAAAGERRLALLGAGSIVGEMALIDDGPRSATVQAHTDVAAREISRPVLRQLLDGSPPLVGYVLESLIAAIRRAYGLPAPERAAGGTGIRSNLDFRRVVERRSFRPGQVFFHQGDDGATAYLIQTGQVHLTRDTADGRELIAALGPGRVFGELALVIGRPRQATAIAAELTVCELIRREEFNDLLGRSPLLLRALVRIYAEQLAGRCSGGG